MKASPSHPKSPVVVKKTISMPEPVYKKGLKNAAKAARTFSNYVATLIGADVASSK